MYDPNKERRRVSYPNLLDLTKRPANRLIAAGDAAARTTASRAMSVFQKLRAEIPEHQHDDDPQKK